MALKPSFGTETVDAALVNVAISRTKDAIAPYDGRAPLIAAFKLREGAQVGTIDDAIRQELTIAIGD